MYMYIFHKKNNNSNSNSDDDAFLVINHMPPPPKVRPRQKVPGLLLPLWGLLSFSVLSFLIVDRENATLPAS